MLREGAEARDTSRRLDIELRIPPPLESNVYVTAGTWGRRSRVSRMIREVGNIERDDGRDF